MRILTVGELSRRSGLPVSTIHFYESKGLIQSWRTAGNQRRFASTTLRLLGIIHFGQTLGIPLSEIAESLATLPRDRVPTHEEWQALSQTWEERLTTRIEALTRLKASLSDCIGCGCLSTGHCPLRNPEDRLAATGSGPRRLLGKGPRLGG